MWICQQHPTRATMTPCSPLNRSTSIIGGVLRPFKRSHTLRGKFVTILGSFLWIQGPQTLHIYGCCKHNFKAYVILSYESLRYEWVHRNQIHFFRRKNVLKPPTSPMYQSSDGSALHMIWGTVPQWVIRSQFTEPEFISSQEKCPEASYIFSMYQSSDGSVPQWSRRRCSREVPDQGANEASLPKATEAVFLTA